MAKYLVNKTAVAHCHKLIDAHQYVISSDWGTAQPSTEQQNDYLEAHSWTDYSLWHLGLTSEASDETKARYAFVYGDLRRVHRSGLSPASTAPQSGITRTSNSPRTTCSSTSTVFAPSQEARRSHATHGAPLYVRLTGRTSSC